MPAFKIRQNGNTVASVTGQSPQAEAEIMRYAYQYRQDGPLTIQVQHRSPTRQGEWYWKSWAKLAQWPDESAVK